MANEITKTILSGVQQSTFDSYASAQEAGVRGKLLFARVTGGTDAKYGADEDGHLVEAADAVVQGKTYVFMGKKCYGSFPQLPVELIDAIGLSIEETNGGAVSSLSEYYTSNNIIDILKEIKQKQNTYEVASSGKTVVVTSAKTGSDISGYNTVFNVEVNNDEVTIITDENGLLSVASSAVSAITKVELDNKSKDVAFVTVEKIDDTANSAVTLGLSGGAEGQVIKVSGDSYVWAYESSTEIASGANSGVVVTVAVDEKTGEKTYNIGGDFYIQRNQEGEGSAVSTSYKLLVKNGTEYVQAGDEIKLLNDNYLKSVEIGTSGYPAQKGFIYTWAVKTDASAEVETTKTFVALDELDTYVGGSGITINDGELNIIEIDLTEDPTNILTFVGDGSASTLYASAVTDITLNGTELDVVDNKVDLGALVSSITTTYNGAANEDVFSGSVSEDGVLSVYLNLSADTIPFDSERTSEIIPSISGNNVQEVIEEIVEQLSGSTDGILSISANGVFIDSYNPSANTDINIPTLTSLTIGDEAFKLTTGDAGISGAIDSISASAITFTYTGTGNPSWTSAETTADWTLNEIIDKLDNANLSGLSAIVTTSGENGTTVELKLNESNTTSQAGGILDPTDDGAIATGSTLDGSEPTNAVKMSQDDKHGLFVYIEISGDDVDEAEVTNAIFYTTDGDGTGTEFGIEAEPAN